ncbi:Phage protein, partial [human gut metagenome]
QSEQVAHKMDEILKRNGFERYTANEKPRYRDGDINLLTNIRKYRFFDWKKERE